MSQADLAKKMICAQSYISKIEQGRLHLEIVVAYKICKCLGVPFGELMDEIKTDLDRFYEN